MILDNETRDRKVHEWIKKYYDQYLAFAYW
jgi:hypothetical protein